MDQGQNAYSSSSELMAGSLSLRFMQQIQPIVDILQIHQLFKSALLHNTTTVHNQNLIRCPDSGRPVGYNEGGLSFWELQNGVLNASLCVRIYAGGCLIQNQKGRIISQCPAEGQKLAFTGREGYPLFFNLVIKTSRQPPNEPMRVDLFGNRFQADPLEDVPRCWGVYRLYLPINWPSARIWPSIALISCAFVMPGSNATSVSKA
jgi:hypothetical protein